MFRLRRSQAGRRRATKSSTDTQGIAQSMTHSGKRSVSTIPVMENSFSYDGEYGLSLRGTKLPEVMSFRTGGIEPQRSAIDLKYSRINSANKIP